MRDYDPLMHLRQTVRRGLVLAGAIAISVGASLSAGAERSDAVLIGFLKTYPVAVDVDVSITQRISWNGIRPGCFAPAEKFDMTYELDLKSRPRRGSKIRNGTATLTDALVGVTPAIGDRGGFRQFSSSAPWELQVKNPAGCPAADPVPPWASSPTCRRIAERVAASLQMEPNGRDGRLTIARTTRKGGLSLKGAGVGASCFRTLTTVESPALAADVAIDLRSTIITLPVRSLRAKLTALAEGSDRARPSFRLPVTLGGDCTAMTVRGSIGEGKNFTKDPYPVPNRPLGNPADLSKAARCTISGRGDFVVRRAGAVTETGLRPGMLPR